MSRNIFQETQAESHAGAHAQRERGEGRGVAEKLSQVQIRTRAPVSIHAWARVRAVRRNSKKKQKRNGRQVDQNCFHTNKPRLTGHYFYALFLSCRTYFLLAGVKSSNYLFRPFACVPRNRYSITDCHSTKRIRAKVTRGVKRERDYSYFSEGDGGAYRRIRVTLMLGVFIYPIIVFLFVLVLLSYLRCSIYAERLCC